MAVFFQFSPTKFTYRQEVQRLRHYQAQKFVGTADAVLIPVIYAAQTPADAAGARSNAPSPSRLGTSQNSSDERSRTKSF